MLLWVLLWFYYRPFQKTPAAYTTLTRVQALYQMNVSRLYTETMKAVLFIFYILNKHKWRYNFSKKEVAGFCVCINMYIKTELKYL